MGYNGGGGRIEPWWSQTVPRAHMRDPIENILVSARVRQQVSGSGGERRMQEEEVYTSGR